MERRIVTPKENDVWQTMLHLKSGPEIDGRGSYYMFLHVLMWQSEITSLKHFQQKRAKLCKN